MRIEDLVYCSCGEKMTVTDSRTRIYGNTRAVWRRRRCPCCKTRSYSVEMPARIAKHVLALSNRIPVKKTDTFVK